MWDLPIRSASSICVRRPLGLSRRAERSQSFNALREARGGATDPSGALMSKTAGERYSAARTTRSWAG
ncbi:hypothetical protein G6F68_020082 [Rhizopus microsporus]|nr:hypothetical protein G6F68_020082 [Rhizopus microsporus]